MKKAFQQRVDSPRWRMGEEYCYQHNCLCEIDARSGANQDCRCGGSVVNGVSKAGIRGAVAGIIVFTT